MNEIKARIIQSCCLEFKASLLSKTNCLTFLSGNMEYLIGQNNVGQKWRKIVSDENFVQESLHLQAVILDKS